MKKARWNPREWESRALQPLPTAQAQWKRPSKANRPRPGTFCTPQAMPPTEWKLRATFTPLPNTDRIWPGFIPNAHLQRRWNARPLRANDGTKGPLKSLFILRGAKHLRMHFNP